MAQKERVSCALVEQCCLDSDEKTANQRIPECFACGNRVCTRCSQKRKYLHFGVKRLCYNCISQNDGHSDFRNLRMYNLCGYPVTMGWIRAMRLYNPNEMYPCLERESLREQIARWKQEFKEHQAKQEQLIKDAFARAEAMPGGRNSALYRRLVDSQNSSQRDNGIRR